VIDSAAPPTPLSPHRAFVVQVGGRDRCGRRPSGRARGACRVGPGDHVPDPRGFVDVPGVGVGRARYKAAGGRL